MKGIKQRVDFRTGRRACDVFNVRPNGTKVRDKRFTLHMQAVEAGYEIRVTDDDTAVDEYRRIKGVEILEDEAAIDAAADSLHDDEPSIQNEALLVEYIRQASVDITDVGGKTGKELARALMDKGCPGIRCRKAPERAAVVKQRLTDSRTSETR